MKFLILKKIQNLCRKIWKINKYKIKYLSLYNTYLQNRLTIFQNLFQNKIVLFLTTLYDLEVDLEEFHLSEWD